MIDESPAPALRPLRPRSPRAVRVRRVVRVGLVAVVALGACGGGREVVERAESEGSPSSAPVGAQPVVVARASAPTSPAAGPYTLHEWGLIDAEYGSDEALALAGALPAVREAPAQPATSAPARGGIPRIQMDVTSVDKPVVYFHLDEGTRSLPLAFAVTPAGGGRVLEHFPPGELSGAGARLGYPHVRVSRGDCRGVYPAPTDAPCDTEDGICEVRELERYETTDADCVHVGEEAAGFLFYRTGPAQLRAPLSLGVESPTAVRVTRAPDQPFPTGADAWVMRVYRPHARRSTVARLAAFGDEDSLVLERAGGEGALDADAAERQLGDALVRAGLTHQERDAFLRAWSVPLFGVPAARQAGVNGYATHAPGTIGFNAAMVDAEASRRLGAVQDSLLYILPQASVDALLPLSLTPPPRASRRVFVVRVNLHRTHRARVALTVSSAGPALDPGVARRVARRHLQAFAECVGEAELSESLQLDLHVRAEGSVGSAALSGAALPSETLACIESAARAMRFPPLPMEQPLSLTLRSFRPGF